MAKEPTDFGRLIKQGLEHKDEGFESGWKPPKNWRGAVKVVRTNTKIKDDGLPRWGLWCEVVDEGDYKGNRTWVNVGFDGKWDFINKHAVDSFAAFGIPASFLQKNSRNPQACADALEGSEAILIAGYRKDKTDPDKEWDNHRFEARKAKLARPVDDDDDDDDEAYDEEEEYEDDPLYEEDDDEEYEEEEPEEEEEPPPPPAKKTRAKAKPASDPAYDPPPAKPRRSRKAAASDFTDD